MSKVKTFSSETAERYALALFELANENSEVDIVEKKVLSLLEICRNNQNFFSFLKNPTYQIDGQKKVFSEIAKIMNFSKIFDNFLQLIIAKRRIYFLDKILEKFIELSAKERGTIEATLTSSKELTSNEKIKINEQISKVIKSNVNFIYSVDKNLISGIKVQIGSLMIENSVSNKLKRMKQSMIEK